MHFLQRCGIKPAGLLVNLTKTSRWHADEPFGIAQERISNEKARSSLDIASGWGSREYSHLLSFGSE